METSSKYTPKNGEISVFTNDKQGNEARPDYTGTLTLDGKTFNVSFWKRVAKTSGKVYLGGEVTERQNSSLSKEHQDALASFDI